MSSDLLKQSAVLLFAACAAVLLVAIFNNNLFGFAPENFFSKSEYSESLVVGGMVAKDCDLDMDGANIGGLSNAFPITEGNIVDSYSAFGQKCPQQLYFAPYRSQYGFLGVFYSTLHDYLPAKGIEFFQALSAGAVALCIIALFFIYRKIFDGLFASIFLVAMATSPWIIKFANNLYFSPYLWFLPAILAGLMYLSRDWRVRTTLLIAVIAAFFVKSLSGYAYLSSIALFAATPFVAGPYFNEKERRHRPNFLGAILIVSACVVGFGLALLIHAGHRGDTLFEGIGNIIEEDVRRRTYGDPSLFGNEYRASLEASALEVLDRYITGWRTPIILWLPGTLFVPLLALASACLCFNFVSDRRTFMRNSVLLGFTFLSPASWFVLAKAHSFIHVHLNFVLWYLGFIPALAYVIISSLIEMYQGITRKLRLH